MISVTLSILGRAGTIIIIQLKHLSKLAIKTDYLMSSSNNMSGEESNMAGLSAISDHHHLHHHLISKIRLRVNCNSTLHVYHLTQSYQLTIMLVVIHCIGEEGEEKKTENGQLREIGCASCTAGGRG
jgi:hypothetical protein